MLCEPAPRGVLRGSKFCEFDPIDNDAPIDHFPHFPSGDKSTRPGAGKLSQERASSFYWTPFTPMEKGYVWKASVCGDDRRSPIKAHMKGGKFYNGGRIVAEYLQGSVIEMKSTLVAHHNGFMEAHVCDVSKCGGDINEECFLKKACTQLMRVPNSDCQSGYNPNCGPIDRNYPGRWYYPCDNKNSHGFTRYGGRYMQYYLPKHLACEHCVIHWYWAAANTCNPPGVVEYFQGPDGPKWGNCKGQGGARGGYTAVQKPCGGRKFAEEYHMCSDIRILSASGGRSAAPKKITYADPPKSKVDSDSKGLNPLRFFKLYADGYFIKDVGPGSDEVIDVRGKKKISFEVIVLGSVSKTVWYINGKMEWVDKRAPYFFWGNSGRTPKYWGNPIFDRRFQLKVKADGRFLSANIVLRTQF